MGRGVCVCVCGGGGGGGGQVRLLNSWTLSRTIRTVFKDHSHQTYYLHNFRCTEIANFSSKCSLSIYRGTRSYTKDNF